MVAPRRYRSGKQAAAPGSVRIIGGRLRGSRLPVPAREGLRPSSDRVRETLFNWLQQDLHGACVLDLFAGSGVLGIEAVSRGASAALLVERDSRLAAGLRESVARLGLDGVEVRCANALDPATLGVQERFDGAFIDPPFDADLWQAALDRTLPHLRPRAWLYIESSLAQAPDPGPGWTCHREGSTREVRYALYRREA